MFELGSPGTGRGREGQGRGVSQSDFFWLKIMSCYYFPDGRSWPTCVHVMGEECPVYMLHARYSIVE